MDNGAAERQLLVMHAVVAFADACTLPSLTPSCPFYRTENGSPTCGEECRDVANSLGSDSRPIAEHRVGGLIMRGREIPLEVASGYQEFDANREFLQHRHLPPSAQPTAALLLGLRHHATSALLGEHDNHHAMRDVWRQLSDRGLPIARMASAGMSTALAEIAAARSAMARLRTLGVLSDVAHADVGAEEWHVFMTLARQALETMPGPRVMARMTASAEIRLPSWLPVDDADSSIRDAVINDETLRFALGPEYRFRLSQWFGRLIIDQQQTAFNGGIPDLNLFASLPRIPFRDNTGKWLWDRFTTTDFRAWSPVSLAFEWNWLTNQECHGVSLRVMGERTTDIDTVSKAYFETMLSRSRPTAQPGFEAAQFAREAADRLHNGQPEEASKIFAGITELRPTDAEAWNNLGFCLLTVDPASALRAFGRSAMFSSKRTHLQVANHLLALHLLGQDTDALLLSQEDVRVDPNLAGAWVWDHSKLGEAGNLTYVDDVPQYLQDTIEHITNRGCVSSVHF